MTRTEETQLLEAAGRGDTEALRALLKLLEPQIFRFGMNMCRHEQDAEDVLQETMLALASSVATFRGDASLSTWLYSVARNSCIKKRRTGKYAPKHEDSLEEHNAYTIESEDLAPDVKLERQELWQQVQEAIAGLDVSHREVLLLRDVEGLSTKEVSEVLRIGEAAIKSRLHRARGQLREALTTSKVVSRCPSLHETLSQYLDGELSADVCCRMQAHLDSCKGCEDDLQVLQDTLRICKRAPPGRVPRPVAQRVEDALREFLSKPSG